LLRLAPLSSTLPALGRLRSSDSGALLPPDAPPAPITPAAATGAAAGAALFIGRPVPTPPLPIGLKLRPLPPCCCGRS
jgi:hypothetical protein